MLGDRMRRRCRRRAARFRGGLHSQRIFSQSCNSGCGAPHRPDLAQAQEKPALEKLPIVAFPFPSLANLTADIIIGKGFDKANGFAAEPVSYGTGGALWAGVAKGELPTHSMSP